jgi:two-component system, chemotaxis family, protein-glutamate methylesterase/glutaminase
MLSAGSHGAADGALERFVTRSLRAIVIGASVGAIETLSVLLPVLARDLRVPAVVVVHLPPRRASLLPQLFRGLCQAPVQEPMDKQPVAAGTIWIAPPDYHLLIEPEHTFALSVDPPVHFSRPAIDVLFASAAAAYGSSLAAVILSGASEDGAAGAGAVRAAGGYVLVQDPQHAAASTMPRAAIAAAQPQFVGSVEQIAAILQHPHGAAS